jgi:hypothetical protein
LLQSPILFSLKIWTDRDILLGRFHHITTTYRVFKVLIGVALQQLCVLQLLYQFELFLLHGRDKCFLLFAESGFLLDLLFELKTGLLPLFFLLLPSAFGGFTLLVLDLLLDHRVFELVVLALVSNDIAVGCLVAFDGSYLGFELGH